MQRHWFSARSILLLSSVALAGVGCSSGDGLRSGAYGVDFVEGSDGTTLCMSARVEGNCARVIEYDWTIRNDVTPATVTVGPGGSATVQYTLTATREVAAEAVRIEASGEVCVDNHGPVPTEGLRIVVQMQHNATGSWVDVAGATTTVTPATQLGAGMTQCYPVAVAFDAVAGASEYRLAPTVTITNFSGHAGTSFGLTGDDFNATFGIGDTCATRYVDEEADVTDSPGCAAGYTCTSSGPGTWHFTGPGSVTHTTTITYRDAVCGESGPMPNPAVLVESGPNPPGGETRTDGADVIVNTPACENPPPPPPDGGDMPPPDGGMTPPDGGMTPPDGGMMPPPPPPPPPGGDQGCTPGYWKNHHDSWRTYSPSQTVGSVFSVPASYGLAGDTLDAALSYGGGSGVTNAARILLRAAVAGLLNSTSGIRYSRGTAALIADVNAALASGNRAVMLDLATRIDRDNNRGCPLN